MCPRSPPLTRRRRSQASSDPTWRLASRRKVLRGLAAGITLPFMASMPGQDARAVETPPKRFISFFTANGQRMPEFFPDVAGDLLIPRRICEPLWRHQADVTFVKGLRSVGADLGGGDQHGTGVASFLTGIPVNTARGLHANNDISIDQVMAADPAFAAPLPSLDISCDLPPVCRIYIEELTEDLLCTYLGNTTWLGPGQPTPRTFSPHAVFERLFGADAIPGSARERARRRYYRQSVLDSVIDQLQSTERRLAAPDKATLDQYLTRLRETEQSLQQSADLSGSCSASVQALQGLEDSPDDRTRIEQMMDLVALAMQCDQTRVASIMLGIGASSRPMPWLGYAEAHHAVSHHGGDPSKINFYTESGRWQMEVFARLVDRMAELQNPDGSRMLDHSLLLFFSGIGDGDTHDLESLPVAIAGTAGGRIPGGRLIEHPGANVNGLLVSLLSAMGIERSSFGFTSDPALPGVLA